MDLLAFFNGTLIWGNLLYEIKTSCGKCFWASHAQFAKTPCIYSMCPRDKIEPEECITLQKKTVTRHSEKHMHIYYTDLVSACYKV